MGNFSVNKKVFIVTGSSSGNGLAISNGLIDEGATVIAIDKESVHGSKFSNFFQLDITDKKELDKTIKTIFEKFGIIDGLVNNAGISISSNNPYHETTISKTLSVNINAPLYLSWKVAEKMKESKGGSIVNICSLGAHLAFPGNPSYQISKAALLQLTKTMALDYGSYGIRVNSISPGYIKTKMTEKSFIDEKAYQERLNRMILNRWGEPKDLLGPCQFLLSSASSYITGTDIAVDGGWMAKGI